MGGNRGGQGTFDWEQIKLMDHGYREHYIGHSVMALASRWQSLKGAMWYSRGNIYNRNTSGCMFEHIEKQLSHGITETTKKKEYHEGNEYVQKKSIKKKINNVNVSTIKKSVVQMKNKEEKIFKIIKNETEKKNLNNINNI